MRTQFPKFHYLLLLFSLIYSILQSKKKVFDLTCAWVKCQQLGSQVKFVLCSALISHGLSPILHLNKP
jgi:hypothetical protein